MAQELRPGSGSGWCRSESRLGTYFPLHLISLRAVGSASSP